MKPKNFFFFLFGPHALKKKKKDCLLLILVLVIYDKISGYLQIDTRLLETQTSLAVILIQHIFRATV